MGARQDRDLRRLEVEGLDPTGLDQGQHAERLDRRAEGHDPVRVAELANQPAGGVDLDDVSAVDALLDPVADLPDEDRRDRPAAASRTAGRSDFAAERRAGLAGTVTVDRSPIGWAWRRPDGAAWWLEARAGRAS